jgi:mannosyltransferase
MSASGFELTPTPQLKPSRVEAVEAPESAFFHKFAARIDVLLPLALFLCTARLWLMPLPSSFWVDEMGTAFVVHYGAAHPSLAAAPQVPLSIYYWLPRAAEALFGFSEISYRLPSVLAMAAALFLTSRLAARLILPQAAWFAPIACLALRGVNDQAADARPYALGAAIAAASLLFLVRWLESGSRRDAALFILCAAALWRVQLVFWPFYGVYTLYVFARLARGTTRAGWAEAAGVFAVLGLALAPVLIHALALFRDAKAHVIVQAPSIYDLGLSLKVGLIAVCGGGAWLLSRPWRWPAITNLPSWDSLVLIGSWWLCQPVCLFGFSWLTGNSVFVARYLYLSLPGAALAATAAAAYFIRPAYWRPLSVVLAAGVLLYLGQWGATWPAHHNSDWRSAAREVSELARGADTPVLCPSPFIEAKPPVWRPDYPLPGFLYAQLPVYPIRGKAYLFPFESSPEAKQYALSLSQNALSASGRFILYGGDRIVRFWHQWFAARPEFANWQSHLAGHFGDVAVVVFEKDLPDPPVRDGSQTPN